jgi:hypothetical protein
MTTLFPLNPEVNDLYQGYYWDGNVWKRSGEDAGFGYLEESALQNTYLSQASASVTYATLTNLEDYTTTVDFELNNEFPIKQNLNSISENYSLSTGFNSISAGPIVIENSVVVTITSGSTWSIV